MKKRSGLVVVMGFLLAPVAALAQMAPTPAPTPPMMGHDAGMAPPPSGNHMGPTPGAMHPPAPPAGGNGMRPPSNMRPPSH